MDPQARRNSLSVVKSFLLRLSLDDERDPVLAMEASAMARVMDDVLNGGVEQEILASLGRIEAGLGVSSGREIAEQKMKDDLDRIDFEARLAVVRNGGAAGFKDVEVVSTVAY